MKLGKTSSTDFGAVKGALARNFDCMGLDCFDIGGVYIDGDYVPGAEPCSNDDIEEVPSPTTIASASAPTPTSSSSDDAGAPETTMTEQWEELFAFDLVIVAVLFVFVVGCLVFSIRYCCRRCGRRGADQTKDGVIVHKSTEEVDFEEVDLQASNHILT